MTQDRDQAREPGPAKGRVCLEWPSNARKAVGSAWREVFYKGANSFWWELFTQPGPQFAAVWQGNRPSRCRALLVGPGGARRDCRPRPPLRIGWVPFWSETVRHAERIGLCVGLLSIAPHGRLQISQPITSLSGRRRRRRSPSRSTRTRGPGGPTIPAGWMPRGGRDDRVDPGVPAYDHEPDHDQLAWVPVSEGPVSGHGTFVRILIMQRHVRFFG